MAYDEGLASRVRRLLVNQRKVEEKKMMGGLTFMVNGKMCVGILKDELMARIDPLIYEKSLTMKGAHEMNFTGRTAVGFVLVSPEGTTGNAELKSWVNLALDFNKKAKPSKKRKKK